MNVNMHLTRNFGDIIASLTFLLQGCLFPLSLKEIEQLTFFPTLGKNILSFNKRKSSVKYCKNVINSIAKIVTEKSFFVKQIFFFFSTFYFFLLFFLSPFFLGKNLGKLSIVCY